MSETDDLKRRLDELEAEARFRQLMREFYDSLPKLPPFPSIDLPPALPTLPKIVLRIPGPTIELVLFDPDTKPGG